MAENQIAIIIIEDKNSTRLATIFVRSFSFIHLDKQIHLLASTPYSRSDPNYNQTIGAGFNHDDIVFNQIKQTDETLKVQFPDLKVRHLLDKGHDDQALFEFIDDLESSFIVRQQFPVWDLRVELVALLHEF